MTGKCPTCGQSIQRQRDPSKCPLCGEPGQQDQSGFMCARHHTWKPDGTILPNPNRPRAAHESADQIVERLLDKPCDTCGQ